MRSSRVLLLVAPGVAAVVLAACGGGGSSVVTVTATASPDTGTGATSQPAPTTSAAPTTSQPAETAAPRPTSDEVTVPDAVGLNYQDAQDTWRAAGLIVLPADDATGANRIPLVDSNWFVVSQTPAAGTVVPSGSDVRATIKKYTDD